MKRAPPQIFDRRKSAAKWNRARARQNRVDCATYLVEAVADDIAERLDFMNFAPKKTLVIGDTNHKLLTALDAKGGAGNMGLLGDFDEERPGPPEAFEGIIHLLGLGVVNDLPGALIHARNSLSEGGLFIAAFPGAGSVPKLRQLALAADGERPAARIHPQVDIRAGTALLERAGFSRQVVDSYPIKVRFSSLDTLVSDLRDHGLTSSLASPAPPITRRGWQRARDLFETLRDEDGKVTETFEILVLTGWR
ncbi:methyltransferase [Erythrobacter crassostreae]|uniref:Methyltransferase n=1 Tax=Erythrobacter crassostreae TaxID=2828328 RepID=A0A9X1JNQ7_9SPHN|nr:methyltransferase [Erythrobacter crassostrea]MBV7259958.1 methyltransferase [Erythrobacter crassostrea]